MIFDNITVCIIDDFLWLVCFWDDTFSGPNLPLFRGGQLGPGTAGPQGPICHEPKGRLGANFPLMNKYWCKSCGNGAEKLTMIGDIC